MNRISATGPARARTDSYFQDEDTRNYRVEEVASPDTWRRDPQLVWDFYSMRRTVAAAAQPNPGHRALAALERTLGSPLFLCTQNVDNLHEQAGSRPLHMQGELFKSRCERCRVPFDDTNSSLPPLADAVVTGPTDDERFWGLAHEALGMKLIGGIEHVLTP